MRTFKILLFVLICGSAFAQDEQMPQTITFNALASRAYDAPPFDLTATASSGLPVSYSSSNTNIIVIEDTRAYIIGTGTVVITASQPGNESYLAAPDVTRQVVITKASQTITFNDIPTKTHGNAPFTLTATASSTLNVEYSTSSDEIGIENKVVTIRGPGVASITASQPGDDNWLAATSVTKTFCVNPNEPSITAHPNGETTELVSSNDAENQWFKNGVAIPGATGISYIATEDGSYYVIAKVETCVSIPSNPVNVKITGVDEFNGQGLLVYPNPVTSKLVIEHPTIEHEVTIDLFDMAGRSVRTEALYFKGSHTMDVSDLGTGVYLLRLSDGEKVFRIRVVK